MPKRMLIDASHPEETRVVILDGHKVEEFDFEAASKRPLKGNIYLAKVTRVEPSLQAAFVEYGGNRQGFLAFSEIHPDYYQIPVADRIALLEAQTQRMMEEDEDGFDSFETASAPAQNAMPSGEQEDEHSEDSDEDGDDEQDDDAHHEDDAAAPMEANVPADTQESVSTAEETQAAEANEATHEDSGLVTGDVAPAEGGESAPASEKIPLQVQTEPEVIAESTGAPAPHQRRERGRDRPRPPRRRQYKIQEVIKRRQIMLVQVVKEERGNKGASLTTFMSLAGRYCVLMPNTPRGGGISRKITNATDRKRLKSAAQSLELPQGMGLIIRTAGANRTKVEIKRDYEYLLRLWDTVRELTLQSNAPALVYEEGSLIKRVIRDLYNKDISEVIVDGDNGYKDAKEFMRMLMPSHAKNVKPYKEPLPLFQRFHVEAQLDAMFSPTVQLKSGGYIVINQTEALVSIDVNSGKATREHSIEETAHKTNLEAADEIGRQLRLRDLAGLIVIDFIDMEDGRNDRNVEKRLHNAVRGDRARVQIGKISQFGLMEMSRQRLRAGVLAGSTVTCPHCNGQGLIRSTESAALRLLRALDEEGQKNPSSNITVKAPSDVTIYTLNQKRREVARIEDGYDLAITFDPQVTMVGGSFEIERTGVRPPSTRPKGPAISIEGGFAPSEPEESDAEIVEETDEEESEVETTAIASPPASETPVHSEGQEHRPAPAAGNGQTDGQGRKRRRRRRGGRGRGDRPQGGPEGRPDLQGSTHGGSHGPSHAQAAAAPSANGEGLASHDDHDDDGAEPSETSGSERPAGQEQTPLNAAEAGRKRRRRRGRRGRRRDGEPGQNHPRGESVHAGASPDGQAQQEHQAEPHQDVTVPEIAPNAPSSPQWSLAERAPEPVMRQKPESPPAPEPRREEPAPAQAESATAATADESGKPSRKGWWQSRFKT